MTVIPVIMGGVIELVGMENAFLVIGAVLLVLVLALGLYVRRTLAYSG